MNERTLVILELDGAVVSSQVDAALKAAGLHTTGDTTSYAMDRIRTGVEHSYRPDEVCRHCGYPDPSDGVDEAGFCTDCQEATGGVFVPRDEARCKSCGAPHEGQPACDVFTQDQLAAATGFCPDCHWPEFTQEASHGL